MKRRSNSAILPKIATLAGGAILGSLVYSTTAFAAFAPLIMEVQPVPIENPTQLVIYGQYFGTGPYGEDPLVNPDPMFTFGTYDGHLFIPVDQSMCSDPPPAPLDSGIDGYSCVVVDLPLGDAPFDAIIPGDYLVEIWAIADNLACAAKPSSLTFRYVSAPCSWTSLQENTCDGPPPGEPASLIAGGSNNATWVLSTDSVFNLDEVILTGGEGPGAPLKWPNELYLSMTGPNGTQSFNIHTSCSQPLMINDVFGSMTLVAMDEAALGPSMQHDEYDLTIGAVGPEGPEGPQGVQGKIGDTGEQGVQGKIGDTGEQGVQGKIGDTGEQGVQGKIGDTGEQGVQGKIGDTGEQGVQGKIGDTGEQGVQGKIGDTGAQGVQGKIGDTGAQGVQGKIGDTGAQGVQGKLGDTGAQGVQGKLGDTGAQGVQGKLGDTGAQGVQGKLGDTGAQGVQGKLGDTGAQGVQGKLGDTGAQGVQGKLGDTGAQGVQGKIGPQGDTGAQGVQGKLGDTGAQGVQGKLGDTGAQGVQGKLGDTGAQGVQGKLGDTGAQGVQGKLGDTGAQGVQGKLGDTGAQGVQGKIGDTGDQGVQGKKGDTGDTGGQGVQGKIGDTGDQGVQGKKGDTGDTGGQGVQGKIGDAGDQGVQGKLGDTGDQGPQGKIGPQGPKGDKGDTGQGANLMCFSTDQTIGTQGKYMGLGQQGGDHDSVSVVMPFGQGSLVTRIVVKVSQGNTARDGTAWLYHDDHAGPGDTEATDEGHRYSLPCNLVGGEGAGGLPDEFASVCLTTPRLYFGGDSEAAECPNYDTSGTAWSNPNWGSCGTTGYSAEPMKAFDSLSVFQVTAGGSFEGSTACTLIEGGTGGFGSD